MSLHIILATLIVDRPTNDQWPTNQPQRNWNTVTIGHSGIDAPLNICWKCGKTRPTLAADQLAAPLKRCWQKLLISNCQYHQLLFFVATAVSIITQPNCAKSIILSAWFAESMILSMHAESIILSAGGTESMMLLAYAESTIILSASSAESIILSAHAKSIILPVLPADSMILSAPTAESMILSAAHECALKVSYSQHGSVLRVWLSQCGTLRLWYSQSILLSLQKASAESYTISLPWEYHALSMDASEVQSKMIFMGH